MSATVKVSESEPDQLDLYRLRDDLAHSHNPVNAHERMLVTQIAQSWLRLQRAYDTERRYCAGQDMVDILKTRLNEFKAVTRYVTDCERAWRHAVLNLEKAKRRRLKEGGFSPNARRTPIVERPEYPPAANASALPQAPLVASAVVSHRE